MISTPATKGSDVMIARAAAFLAAILLVASSAACSSDPKREPDKPKTATVAGDMTLPWTGSQGRDGFGDGNYCAGKDGYDDIAEGAQVVVTDRSGEVVAIGALESGRMRVAYVPEIYDCVFHFVVTDVPTGRNFYGVEVGHRGSLKYEEAKIFAQSLVVTLN
jgi:hypothetical protein